jgi:hypothetical protein
LIAAEKDGRYIAVEIKSFLGSSIIADFHLAIGQFLNYRVALEQQDPHRVLYLAVPIDAYSTLFMQPIAQTIIERYGIHMIVYNPEIEEVIIWID